MPLKHRNSTIRNEWWFKVKALFGGIPSVLKNQIVVSKFKLNASLRSVLASRSSSLASHRFLTKRGYFFILDAVLALFVLVIGVFLITSSYVSAPRPVQVALLSEDLLSFFSNTKIKDLNNPYAGIGGELWNKGDITDADNSLLQQIGEFYAKNKLDTAERFIQNISAGIIPSQFRFEVWVDDTILFPKTPSSEHLNSKSNTRLLLTSKKITFGIINKTTSNLWGPYKAEVYSWER